ncbi:LuxR C-terminal-related transcriptional regulator [Ideonella sp. A 288]|uniref:helix-turn-helix transcriptional regulator n=1 Tax=Ideonella sp. A 288 TaxID=1962181 RepID=UPI000B4ABD3D|nr:LuxR C-terminal-related transcriptional regulator [Ideonella sp. A 288]
MKADPSSPGDSAWGLHALAETDYGIVLVNADHEVIYCNPIAERHLALGRGLRRSGSRLVAVDAHEQPRLSGALDAVLARGHRKMLVLGGKRERLGVAVVRIAGSQGDAGAGVDQSRSVSGESRQHARALLTLSRERICEPLSIYAFARDHGLSRMEELVLVRLCNGQRPHDIAEEHGRRLNTVRTQVMNIRAKTGFESTSELVHWISTLPPMLGTFGATAP